MNIGTKVTTGATATTHDIKLPQGYRDRPWDYDGDLYTEGQVRATIEADRKKFGRNENDHCKRRGEPVAKVRDRGFEVVGGKHVPTVLVEFPVDDWESRDRFAAAIDAPQPLSESDIPAEPVNRKRRYAQGTALGEFGIIPMCDQVNDEPVNAPPATAYCQHPHCQTTGGCQGPCSKKQAEPVKPHLTVKYDDKGDYLYICCDSNEPAEAEEDDQGILLWRAISDGRLIGVTIPNFIGPYIKPVKADAEASVPSDMDIDELSREWGLLSAAYPSKSMVRDFARALLAHYK